MFSSFTLFFLGLLSLLTFTSAAPIPPTPASGLTFVHNIRVEDWTRNAAELRDVSERRQVEEFLDLEKERLSHQSILVPLLKSSSSLSASAHELTSMIKSPLLVTSPSASILPSPSSSSTKTSTISTLFKSLSSPFQKRIQPFLSFPSSSATSSSRHNVPSYIQVMSSSERQQEHAEQTAPALKKRLVPFLSLQGARVGKGLGGELDRERVEEIVQASY